MTPLGEARCATNAQRRCSFTLPPHQATAASAPPTGVRGLGYTERRCVGSSAAVEMLKHGTRNDQTSAGVWVRGAHTRSRYGLAAGKPVTWEGLVPSTHVLRVHEPRLPQ